MAFLRVGEHELPPRLFRYLSLEGPRPSASQP